MIEQRSDGWIDYINKDTIRQFREAATNLHSVKKPLCQSSSEPR